jgi:hypothetical protein
MTKMTEITEEIDKKKMKGEGMNKDWDMNMKLSENPTTTQDWENWVNWTKTEI